MWFALIYQDIERSSLKIEFHHFGLPCPNYLTKSVVHAPLADDHRCTKRL